MITKKITVGTTPTSVYDLLETAGYEWPTSGNDACTMVFVQLEPGEVVKTIEILDSLSEAGEGIVLSRSVGGEISYFTFHVDRVSRVFLAGSVADTEARIFVEQSAV